MTGGGHDEHDGRGRTDGHDEPDGRRRSGAMARASLAFGLVCIAMTGVVLALDVDPTVGGNNAPALLGAAFVAIGLGLHGMAMNDLLDLQRDRLLAAGRMLASRRVGPAQAALMATAALILALLGAGLLGGQSIFVLVLLAAGLLFYNAMARFIPAIGLLMPGLLVAGLSMLSGWPPPVPWLPWSLFTACVAVALLIHLVADKRPRPSPRAMVGLTLEWVVVSVLLLVVPLNAHSVEDPLAGGQGDAGWALVWPAAAIVLLCLLLGQRLRHAHNSVRVADRLLRTTGIWTGVFAASWCMAVDAHGWAIAFAAATAAAVAGLGVLGELWSGDRGAVGWR